MPIHGDRQHITLREQVIKELSVVCTGENLKSIKKK